MDTPATDTAHADAAPTQLDARHREWRSGSHWFREHYEQAASQVVDFFGGDGIALEGKDVADVGCGDGIIDLGVHHRSSPRSLTGFDLRRVDTDRLAKLARAHGVTKPIPESLRFLENAPTALPVRDASFDVAFSWSAFEHVLEPVALLEDVRRVLRPTGVLMIQLFPFFMSEHGSHLPEWAPDGFLQLEEHGIDRVEAAVRADLAAEEGWADTRLEEARTLNRIRIDDLHRALLAAGFWVSKVEPISNSVHLPRHARRFSLSDLIIGGVKLLASPA